MDNSSDCENASASPDDSEDLDDIPILMAHNARYEHDDGPPAITGGVKTGFARPAAVFQLQLPPAKPQEVQTSAADCLQPTRSEPVCLPEASRRQVPALSLSLNQGRKSPTSFNAGIEVTPLRPKLGPPKPPMLNLANPASASPVPSGAPTPGVDEAGDGPTGFRQAWQPVAAVRAPLQVDLVSRAFSLQNLQQGDNGEASTSERIIQRCTSQLGIAPTDLEFFELRRLEDGNIPETCTHIGVAIRGSSFTLTALEDMIARSRKDAQLTSMLERALRDSAQHAAETKRLTEELGKRNEELAGLRERLRCSEETNQHLREQLSRANEQRQMLGETIRTVRREFQDLRNHVDFTHAVDRLPLQRLSVSMVPGSTGEEPPLVDAPGGPSKQAAPSGKR